MDVIRLLRSGINDPRNARYSGDDGCDVRATVRVQPAVAALNRFDVLLTDRTGNPITNADRVSLRFNMLTMDMGESELTARPIGDGHYVAQGGNLAMAGPWQIDVIVRLAGLSCRVMSIE